MTLIRSVLLTVLTLACAAGHVFAQAPDAPSKAGFVPATFDAALAQGRDRNTPVLLEFYTEW